MGLPWFRFYTEWADDPKVQMLSEAHQRRLAMLFCYQGQGWLPQATDEELSFKLRISLDELEKTRAAFQRQGFIGLTGWSLTNWAKRQRESDISTPRVKKHRMKRNETVSETANETNETVQDKRRGEQIRIEQKRLEERRDAAPSGPRKRNSDLLSLSSLFMNGSTRATSTKLPQTRSEMIGKGYEFSNSAPCNGCGEEIEWWTSPKGARLPMNKTSDGPGGAVVHLVTCSSAAEFRRAN